MQVFSATGVLLCELNSFEFNGVFMESRSITATKKSPDPINFKVGSYVVFRGEKFRIYYPKPKSTKKAESGLGIGDAFEYPLIFYSEMRKLADIGFYDYVPGYDDTEIYYTGSSEVSFFGTVIELAGRIDANLQRFYAMLGETNPWTVTMDSAFMASVNSGEVILTEKLVSFSKGNCRDALIACHDQFEIEFRVNGNAIVIGGNGGLLPFSLEYGKDKGLRELGVGFDEAEPLITRLSVFGSSDNLPPDYRKSEQRVTTNLRLPESWGSDYIDIDYDYDLAKPETHIWRELKEEYGIIEGAKEPYADIRPSIEGAIGQSGGYLDEVYFGSDKNISDTAGGFTVTVLYPGFNPLEYIVAGDSPRISLKSQRRDGHAAKLGGYEFVISGANLAGLYLELVLTRNTEEISPLPSQTLSIDTGDKFVYLGIAMPNQYILLAEDKLLAKGKQDIRLSNGLTMQYTMTPSAIYMARNPDIADLLVDGNRLPVIDSDMELSGQPLKVQNVNIKYEGDKEIPVYSVTLANAKLKSLRDSIRVAGQSQKNYNTYLSNNLKSTTNITNITGGDIPTWEIID